MNRIHEILWTIVVTIQNSKHQSVSIHKVPQNHWKYALTKANGYSKISKYHRIPENEQIDIIMNRIHAPTKGNGHFKYEQNLLNIVGGSVVTSAGPEHQSVYSKFFWSSTES